jgi:phage repressor protein C with HTH and peptisase S24 domain
MDQDFIKRIGELVTRAGGQTALARKTGMSLGAIQRYIKGGEPTRIALIKLAETCDVTLNWLVYGSETQQDAERAGTKRNYRLYGFGDSSPQEGWYSEVEYKISTALDYPDPECFAIVVADNRMEPVGLMEGQVCIISPHTELQKDDIVFIRNKDKQATLKVFVREDSEWVYLKSWFADGQAYEDQVKRSQIDQMGPVIFIKRR